MRIRLSRYPRHLFWPLPSSNFSGERYQCCSNGSRCACSLIPIDGFKLWGCPFRNRFVSSSDQLILPAWKFHEKRNGKGSMRLKEETMFGSSRVTHFPSSEIIVENGSSYESQEQNHSKRKDTNHNFSVHPSFCSWPA